VTDNLWNLDEIPCADMRLLLATLQEYSGYTLNLQKVANRAFAQARGCHIEVDDTHRSLSDMTGQAASALFLAGDPTDRQLLERFVSGREEAAFAALVQRHGAVVWRVCRRELACEQDAEDVFQATFLALARQAPLVPWQDSVGHWLQTVARRLSLRARCSASRLRWRGALTDHLEPPDTQADPLAEAERRELSRVLDEELGRLPEMYRAPVVLCYLQGKTNEQAACELGWPAGSMSRRLARARALLRERLSRRGLALFALGCLALACLWLLAPSTVPQPQPGVATAMASFGPGGDCEEGFERALLRVVNEPRVTGEGRDRLVRMTQQAVQVSDVVAAHDPGRRRHDWRRLSEQMHASAVDLNEALAQNDERKTQTAARRLAMTCQNCHATFRD
jgi:RNA polymerase sigma factor (sigma-70 family)